MKRLSILIAVATMAAGAWAADVGSDDGSNYLVTPFADGSNGGTGFSAWTFDNNNDGSTIFAGGFIGDSTQNGRFSIGNEAFGLYANPEAAYMNAQRNFAGGAMLTGQAFSFDWNFSWNGGARGFSLYSDDSWTTEILNMNHGGGNELYVGGAEALANVYNVGVKTVITALSPTQLSVALYENGAFSPSYSDTFNVAALPQGFKFYNTANPSDQASNYELFFNNLNMSPVPEPTTLALIGLGLGAIALRRRARG